MDTLSLPKALEKLGEFRAMAELINKDNQTQREEDSNDKKFTITFQIQATRKQIENLSKYLNENHIDFTQIKGD